MTPVQKIAFHASHTEFRRYFWAGSLTFIADFTVLMVLTEVFDVNYLWSNLIAVSVGLVVSYLLCISWVFNDRRYNRVIQELPIFALTSIIGLILNEMLLWAFVEFGKVHYLMAKIVVTLTIFTFNFCLKKIMLFSR